jgi:Protein of unknown function (DUF433)
MAIISTINYRNYITIEANKRGGKPCVRGLRITVYDCSIIPMKLLKEFSCKRVFVEHRIRSVKIFRVVQDRFRLNPKKY